MSRRTGSADLPLHGGRVPEWLAARMARLGRVIVEAITLRYGRDEVLRRLAHPFWFQSFGAVMGMDWHSSGITTSVLAALKRGLRDVRHELGLHVCGGRGGASRQTPAELCAIGERTGLDGEALAQTSRLVAKIDSAAVQDGFALYLHGFVVTDDGAWVVVQQGMNAAARTARRYHWLSTSVSSFVEAPHTAIEGRPTGVILNLTDPRSGAARESTLALVTRTPELVAATLERARSTSTSPLWPDLCPRTSAADEADARGAQSPATHLTLPAHHDVRAEDIDLRRLRATVLAAHARGPADFAALLLTPGLGARTVRALAHVAEVIHGAPARFSDPARFSLALGGKDGHPYPVPLRVYDETLRVLRDAVSRAQLGHDDRMAALERLDAEARRIEGTTDPRRSWAGTGRPTDRAEPALLDALLQHEHENQALFGGRTVFDSRPSARRRGAGQHDATLAATAPTAAAPPGAQLRLPWARTPPRTHSK